jgi:hypothetical protein
MSDVEQWIDLRSAVAMSGATRSTIAWAMAMGDVRYSTTLPGHQRTPMLALDDVEWLASLHTDAERTSQNG